MVRLGLRRGGGRLTGPGALRGAGWIVRRRPGGWSCEVWRSRVGIAAGGGRSGGPAGSRLRAPRGGTRRSLDAAKPLPRLGRAFTRAAGLLPPRGGRESSRPASGVGESRPGDQCSRVELGLSG